VARPRSGRRRAGKKERVAGEGIFARPSEIFGGIPARRLRRRAKNQRQDFLGKKF